MPLRPLGASRHALVPVALATLAACSSGSGSGGVDAGAAHDAGSPADALVLPHGLETCNDTAAPTRPASTSVAFAAPPAALGDGVREDSLIGSLMTVGSVNAPMQGLSGQANSNAVPLTTGGTVLETDKVSDSYYTFSLVPGSGAKLTAYEKAAVVDPTLDIALRETSQTFQSGVTSDDFTANAGVPTKAGDQYVWEVDAVSLFDATLSVRFAKDPACHLRNIARIIGGDVSGPLPLHDVLTSDSRSLVELYARSAPATETVVSVVATLPSAPSLDASMISCTFTDLSTCDAAVQAIDSAESAYGKTASKGSPTKSDYASETMPVGWTFDTVETMPVSE